MMREMKDSEVPWIGEIPASLKLIRNKYLLSYEKGKKADNTNLDQEGLPYIGASDLDSYDIAKLYTTDVALPNVTYDDILILWDGARAGLVGTNKVGKLSSTVVKLIPNKNVVNKRFLYWYYLAFQQYMYDMVNGTTIPHMNRRFIEDIGFLSWSLDEQNCIVNYLDTKCSQIDTIIAKEQSVIEKLQEYRQSIITETVTSGLDSTKSQVSSGVEWIARIPLNWKITRFTMSFEFFKGLNIKKTDLVDSGACVVSYGQVHAKNNNGYSLRDDLIRYVAENLIDEKSLLQEGDFVFADTSEDLEGVGNCIYIDSLNEVYAGYHTLVARCLDKSMCTKYFAFLFLTDIWRSQLRKNANGTKVYSVTQKMFKAVSCLVPPIEEQLKIVAYLEQKCDSIDRVISYKLTIIDTLTEYKKSLIYEVVTGKKEVPHV